ncbi:MAG: HPr family phosphocarrier protein [Myxococcales bacterium]|nr:HPr family phosphocarrier protein [Myxococcales bacterium]
MTKGPTSTKEGKLEIQNDLGMHARAATKFVQTANRWKSEVTVEKDGQVVNGKSIMGVLMLVASKGTFITVLCTGPDAEQAFGALAALVNDKFGEQA